MDQATDQASVGRLPAWLLAFGGIGSAWRAGPILDRSFFGCFDGEKINFRAKVQPSLFSNGRLRRPENDDDDGDDEDDDKRQEEAASEAGGRRRRMGKLSEKENYLSTRAFCVQ